MNLRVLVSKAMLLPAAIVLAFGAWAWLGGFEFGRGRRTDVPFLLWTGWITFGIYVFLLAYVVRKHVHRYGVSPEFLRELPLDKLESVERALSSLRAKVHAGVITERRRLEAEAKAVIAREGCDRVLRAEVTVDPGPSRRLVLRAAPRNVLAPLHVWFREHVCWGAVAVFLLWFHGGSTLTSPMAQALNLFSWAVLGSGLVGVVLFGLGPYWLTRRERDLSLEKAFALRDHFQRKLDDARGVPRRKRGSPPWREPTADEAAAAVAPHPDALDDATRRSIEAAIRDPERLKTLLASDERGRKRAYAILLSQSASVEREWSALARIRNVMHAWRIVHVPLAFVLMMFVLVHVVSVIWY